MAIFTPSFFLFAVLSASVLPIKPDLYLNDDQLSTAKSTSPSISSLLNCDKLPEVSE